MVALLNRIACFQGRCDEVPNQELARDLTASEDQAGIREIAENLWHPEPSIRSDCLKVLYEIGYLKPELIASYTGDFLKLLRSRNNRLVWGGMTALSTVARVAADQLYPQVAEMQRVMESGSIITIDAGVLALSRLAATNNERRSALLPYLLNLLRNCHPSDVLRHADRIFMAVTPSSKAEFVAVLQTRMPQMLPAQTARLKKVIRQAEAR